MLQPKDVDAGGGIVTIDEPPEEPEWGGLPEDWSPWIMEIGPMHHLIKLPRLRSLNGAANSFAIDMIYRWEKWCESDERRVAVTRWPMFNTELSTVCLIYDILGSGFPYESAVFYGDRILVLARYKTRQQAWMGHHNLAYWRPWLRDENDEEEEKE